MGHFAIFLFFCLPAFNLAGLALEPNEAGDLTLFETENQADSEAVRKLFSIQRNVTARQESLVWENARDGKVPPNSVCAGTEYYGAPLYVAQISLPSGRTPGKLSSTNGGAYVSYGGVEIFQARYEVLTNPSGRALKWQAFIPNSPPPNGGFVGGIDIVAGSLYVARVRRSDGMIVPAKAAFKYGLCYAPYGGKEEAYSDGCDILVPA